MATVAKKKITSESTHSILVDTLYVFTPNLPNTIQGLICEILTAPLYLLKSISKSDKTAFS